MGDKFDSTRWTGDYPKRAHVALDSPEGRRVKLRLVRNAVIVLAVIIGANIAWQVFA